VPLQKPMSFDALIRGQRTVEEPFTMNSRFAEAVASHPTAFERLLTMWPVTCTILSSPMPKSRIYLLSEGAPHL